MAGATFFQDWDDAIIMAVFCCAGGFDLTPKEKWKHQQHCRRWEKRCGKPYPTPEAKFGFMEGFRFIE